jgi:hypothetical protein
MVTKAKSSHMTDAAATFPSVEELNNRFYECEGRHIESELRGLALSFRTFHVNASLLLDAAHKFECAFPNPLLAPSRQRELEEYGFEMVRLFQNAVASGQSYVDHCCTSVKHRYRRHPFIHEFKEQFDRCIESVPVCQFVRAVRNFQLHNESISASVLKRAIGLGFKDDQPVCQILLSTDALNARRHQWIKEHAKAVSYLDSIGDSIDVSRLLAEFYDPVNTLRTWLRERELSINAAASFAGSIVSWVVSEKH